MLHNSRNYILTNVITFLLVVGNLAGQNNSYFTPEFSAGFSAPSNENFPDRKIQLQGLLHYSLQNTDTTKEWIQRLNFPVTGFTAGYTNLGNNEALGSAYSLMPFLQFKNFKNERWVTQINLGTSYFTNKANPRIDLDNRSVTTDFVWSFRAFTYYTFLKKEHTHWRAGLGVFHHSNGHTRLPNNGYNSFLLSLSAQVNPPDTSDLTSTLQPLKKTSYSYLNFRAGLGQNVFYDGFPFNNKKEVYTVSGEVGKVYNNILRVGIGGFYRIYEHYYDYINDNEFLVRDGQPYAHLRSNPWKNASNIAFFTRGELLLNHIGIELMVGVNLYKPAYEVDWYLNDGWDFAPREIPDIWVYGEFNSKYEFKKIFSTRLGVNYYLKGTNTFTPHNFVAGVHLNTNLGQADFSEVSLGYVYSFGFKKKN